MVGIVFITSGWHHLKDPEARSKSIGLSKNLTILVGAGEVLGSLGLMLGVLTQMAAFGLILIMLGAIYKKIFAWHVGFWGESLWLALRPDIHRDESGHHLHQWRPL